MELHDQTAFQEITWGKITDAIALLFTFLKIDIFLVFYYLKTCNSALNIPKIGQLHTGSLP